MFKRRLVQFGAVCVTGLAVLWAATVKVPGMSPWGKVMHAPARVDGMVTISTSPDKQLTFITCAPNHPPIWRRLTHSILTCAFMVQYRKPTSDAVAHTGRANIDFRGDLLSIVFDDSSQFVFTTQAKGSTPLAESEMDNLGGIVTYRTAGLETHADFVGSRDWTKRGSCGI